GNARMGAARTIIRKGGGVAFAKTQRTEVFRKKMPNRMRRLANRNALLAKLVDNEVLCIDSLDFGSPSTKEFEAMFSALGINRTCLVALRPEQRNAALSARNIDDADTVRVDQLNVFELLNHRFLVIDKASLQSFLDGSAWPNSGDDKEAA
ncbi:MAG: uL4 family ribosomal protein, partial [Phycisphaerales bacterium]|nr:uL4 family ribosomal protein [Phycisphaerales bacterium]